jgi:predicted Zn-dependent peptidase
MKIPTLRRASLCVVLALLIVLILAPVSPLDAAEETVAVQPVEQILPSGAKALLWPRPGSGTVLVTVAVSAGSQDEPPEMGGLSHYLEHLLFDGFDDLDERGVTEAFERLSAYMNAFTREQTTVYFALVPREDAVATAELMVGMLTRSTIEPATYEKEKKVILEELAKDHASPDGLKEERLRSVLWADTPLQHPVGGTVETVTNTTRDEVVRYWKRRYGPTGYRLLVTGDLPVEGLERVLAPFAKLPATTGAPARGDQLEWTGWGEWAAAPVPEAPQGGGMPAMGMGMGMGHGMPDPSEGPAGGTLALVLAAPDSLAKSATSLELISRWMEGSSGPLTAALIPEYARSLSVVRMPREPRDLIEIRIEAVVGVNPAALVARTLGAFAAAAAGPEDGEVLAIRRAWTGERALDGQRLHYAAVFYGDALASTRGDLAEAVEPVDVAPDGVRAAAAELFTGVGGRTRAAWLGDGGPAEGTRLPEAIAPVSTDRRSALDEGHLGSLVATLDNGLTVGILPEAGSAVFGIHLLVADRTLFEPADAPGVSDLIHRLLIGGTVLGGSRDLEGRIERAGLEIKPADSPAIPFDNRYHVPDFSYVRIEGPSDSLGDAFEILAEMVRVPAWDEEGWREAVDGHTAARKADNRGGEKAKQLFFATLLGAENPLAKPVSGPLDAPIADEAEIRAVWEGWPNGYFAPDRLVLTVASPLPAGQTLELIKDSFSGGPAAEPRRGPYPAPQPAAIAPTVEIGDAPQVTLLWGRIAEVAAADRAPLLVAVDALSDRMTAVIREREGLAYRLGAGVRAVPGGAWILSASVGTRPENRERVTGLLEELVAGLAREPLSTDDLARLNARQRRSRMLRGLSAASRAYRVGRALFEGDGSPLAVNEAAYAAVTPEQVQAAARKYLVADDMLLVVTP